MSNNDVEVLEEEKLTGEVNFKVILVGDSNVGKTSISLRLTKNEFAENQSATIGYEFFNFFAKYKNKKIMLQIVDTCGQEKYNSLSQNFFTNASAAFVVYSITE